MADIIRSKRKHRQSGSTVAWLIFGIIINCVGLFLVVRWYGQFTENQRPLTDIDESIFKVFASPTADSKTLTSGQRQLLKKSLTEQTVEEFLSLSLLSNPKFQQLKTNYTPEEINPNDVDSSDELSGLVIGNPRPFNY
jgi:hypothetical protein